MRYVKRGILIVAVAALLAGGMLVASDHLNAGTQAASNSMTCPGDCAAAPGAGGCPISLAAPATREPVSDPTVKASAQSDCNPDHTGKLDKGSLDSAKPTAPTPAAGAASKVAPAAARPEVIHECDGSCEDCPTPCPRAAALTSGTARAGKPAPAGPQPKQQSGSSAPATR